jgi:hypothetical protein
MFDDYTFDEAQEVITALKDEGVASNRAFRSGDHWQDGEAWIGPKPLNGDADRSSVLLEIQRGLVSKNAVAEVTQRHTSAVIGREAAWSFTVRRPLGKVEKLGEGGQVETVDERPDEAEQALIDEAEAFVTEWWDARKVLHVLQRGAKDLTDGRGVLRLFVPKGVLQEQQRDGETVKVVPSAGDLGAALKLIYVHAPNPDEATVLVDDDTQQPVGMYAYTVTDGDTERARIALCYAQPDGMTVVRVVGEKDDPGIPPPSDPFPLNGNLTVFEMKMDALVTAQVRQNQALLNMALTMMGRNVVLGGFLERVFLNAQMPGTWEVVDGKRVFVPGEFYTGAGSTNFLQGTPVDDGEGGEKLATPSVVYKDPVSVETFRDTKAEAYAAILEETHQLHALIAGDAVASGESRKQAMDDFRKSLEPTKAQLDAAGRWVLETALAWAAQFAGTPGRFSELRAVFDCQVDVGDPTADEVRVGIELVKEKVWSRARLQAETGVDDTDAETAAIAAEDERLNPTATIQRERATLNLEADRRNLTGDAAGVAARIEGGAQDLGVTA